MLHGRCRRQRYSHHRRSGRSVGSYMRLEERYAARTVGLTSRACTRVCTLCCKSKTKGRANEKRESAKVSRKEWLEVKPLGGLISKLVWAMLNQGSRTTSTSMKMLKITLSSANQLQSKILRQHRKGSREVGIRERFLLGVSCPARYGVQRGAEGRRFPTFGPSPAA